MGIGRPHISLLVHFPISPAPQLPTIALKKVFIHLRCISCVQIGDTLWQSLKAWRLSSSAPSHKEQLLSPPKMRHFRALVNKRLCINLDMRIFAFWGPFHFHILVQLVLVGLDQEASAPYDRVVVSCINLTWSSLLINSMAEAQIIAQTARHFTSTPISMKLDEDNFLQWKDQVESMIEGHNLLHHIAGSNVPTKFTDTGALTDEYTHWK
ncbi:hypothetical protein PIB30_070587 [Stylosanthes scabra]|uniref:Uncharacterized protein n=1 Tax=Stylosanthes scabra TaxID=79078 RepID=A0ABU6WLU2_9FABA|nr:hypothetical protein [Stylosanthes scabra]